MDSRSFSPSSTSQSSEEIVIVPDPIGVEGGKEVDLEEEEEEPFIFAPSVRNEESAPSSDDELS